MKSKILQKDQDDLIKLSQKMTPEERLVAFFNHSHLMSKIQKAGQRARFKRKKSQK